MSKTLNQLKRELKKLSKDMVYSFVGDENYAVISWDFEKKGAFNLENWLVSEKALKAIKPAKFVTEIWKNQSQKTAQSIQHLVSILNGKFENLTIYGFGFPKIPKRVYGGDIPLSKSEIDPIGAPVFVFSDEDENWYGLILRQGRKTEEPTLVLSENFIENTHSKEIKKLFEIIDYQSVESSWRLKNSWFLNSGKSREEVFLNLLSEARFFREKSVEKFLNLENILADLAENDPISEEQILNDFFTENLNETTVWTINYNIGGETWSVHYVWGRTAENDWLGVQTVSFTF